MQHWGQVAPVLHHHGYQQLEVYHFAHEVMLFPYCATVCKLTGILHIDNSYPGGWLIEHILWLKGLYHFELNECGISSRQWLSHTHTHIYIYIYIPRISSYQTMCVVSEMWNKKNLAMKIKTRQDWEITQLIIFIQFQPNISIKNRLYRHSMNLTGGADSMLYYTPPMDSS